MRPRLPILALALTMLAACQDVALVGLVENANYKTSGRSVSGWAISALTDEDCEPMRIFESQPFCRPRPHQPPPVDPFCYRSIADVTCYNRADTLMPPGRLLPAPGQVP
jgi:hypothetical protein